MISPPSQSKSWVIFLFQVSKKHRAMETLNRFATLHEDRAALKKDEPEETLFFILTHPSNESLS